VWGAEWKGFTIWRSWRCGFERYGCLDWLEVGDVCIGKVGYKDVKGVNGKLSYRCSVGGGVKWLGEEMEVLAVELRTYFG
jgi:hypothetical protein